MIAVLRYLFIPAPPKAPVVVVAPKPTQYELIAARLKELAVTRAKQVYSSDLSIVKIFVYRKTIEEYIDLLKTLSESFEKGISIPQGMVVRIDKPVYLRDFFQDRNNCFLDPEETMLRFAEQAERFLLIYQRMELHHAKSFSIEKNLHLTAQIVSNLSNLSEGF